MEPRSGGSSRAFLPPVSGCSRFATDDQSPTQFLLHVVRHEDAHRAALPVEFDADLRKPYGAHFRLDSEETFRSRRGIKDATVRSLMPSPPDFSSR